MPNIKKTPRKSAKVAAKLSLADEPAVAPPTPVTSTWAPKPIPVSIASTSWTSKSTPKRPSSDTDSDADTIILDWTNEELEAGAAGFLEGMVELEEEEVPVTKPIASSMLYSKQVRQITVDVYKGRQVSLRYRDGEPLYLTCKQISEIGVISGQVVRCYRKGQSFKEKITGNVYVRWDADPDFVGIHIRHGKGQPGVYVFPDTWYPLMDVLRTVITS